MNFSLIICTYMRPMALLTLLKSLESQVFYPNEIIIVDGETGCMVNPSDTEVFLIKIICLLENKEASLRMAKQARQRVKNDFDVYEIFQENINLYKNIL